MATGRRVNIKQVAREAGVSTQTVSRVLNDRPDVAPDTRRRVKEVINRLGYQPSNIARSLIQGRSRTLGVVGTGLEYYGPSRVLVGIVNQANALGYSLSLSLIHDPESNDVERLLQAMYAQHVDGIVWAVPQIGANRDWIQREGFQPPVPLVLLTMAPHPQLTTVSIDNYAGGRMAVQHLIDLGYRQIGLITGPLSWWEARERRRGWQDALEAAGLPAPSSLVVEGNWSAASGEQGLLQLREQHPSIDAIFVCNDQMALGVLKAARQIGLHVPEDMAIVGFDDIPEAAFFCPPLTSIRQELIDLGARAVVELDRLIHAGRQDAEAAQHANIALQPHLVVRESSGAVPPTCTT